LTGYRLIRVAEAFVPVYVGPRLASVSIKTSAGGSAAPIEHVVAKIATLAGSIADKSPSSSIHCYCGI